MKIRALVIVLACLSPVLFAAPPKVAVLDAVLPEKMDKDVAIGVTEKISEELVGSGKYTVLDRTTVGQSLKEIEFQMSGLVSDADIKKAGEQLNSRLGASFVVVAKVSLVGETYFISAKMIDIKTGEITAQASDEEEGKIAVTLKVAQRVGKKLAGGVKEAEKVPVTGGGTVVTGPGPEKPAAAQKALHSRVFVSYMLPMNAGTAVDTMNSYTFPSDTFEPSGWSLHVLQFLFSGLYGSAAISGTGTGITWLDSFSVSHSDSFFSTMDVQLGAGWGFPLGGNIQFYVGALLGYTSLTLGTFWTNVGASDGALSYGVEVGADWILLDFLSVSGRLSYGSAGLPAGNVFTFDESLSTLGISIGVGLAY